MTEFEQIYETHFKEVFRYVLYLSREESTAEEITQETFFKALKNIDKFKGDCDIRSWLCQIAKNTYFSHLAKGKKTTNQIPERPTEKTTEEAYLNKENAAALHEILHELPEPYKEVFYLRTFGELPFAQIGQLFRKTESWARVTYHRAKLKIQGKMEKENE